ncbi:TPR repeat-containing protein C19B12.01 [Fusarium oxysporum f. sp. cubense race 1]|uniref:TPR repeat-containing protein C19B12.01 n=1 Tax=Fusarium oxysporum f. sp. cubense (strain race 1) TaxID=1229664 RepID=N4UYF8_FUSC1|nr:TPR repeat-containing protein C19B12.01 [Fusarium oxysporum f. sp. cubense race 1]
MGSLGECGSALRNGRYASIILSKGPGAESQPAPNSTSGSVSDPAPVAGALIQALITRLTSGPDAKIQPATDIDIPQALAVGLAALNAFLQVNVTGPVLPESAALSTLFTKAWASQQSDDAKKSHAHLHKACLSYLEVDGVSPYAYIPHLELFALAKYIITQELCQVANDVVEIPSEEKPTKSSVAWTQLRVNIWHYKLLTQPTLGHGSNFARSSQWSDVPTLASQILDGIDNVRSKILGEEVWASGDDGWSRDDKVQFLVEAANNYILLGRDDKANEAIKEASQTSGLEYALSGALGKRTKFQENSISQLVVLAAKPDALQLNDDTLHEEIQFTRETNGNDKKASLPAALADLSPDDQPQLSPLDQIILLTEATLKDAFSPIDTLTSAEVLPYAVRVIGDKSTNWQIYTQALLVRSRIEVHRSRTVERGVLQLQAVADQVLTDTTAEAQQKAEAKEQNSETDAPAIQITSPDEVSAPVQPKPTSFLPAPKASESAPAHVRLEYIHAICSPPRWHLESELAYAWAGIGSLASALEIFKRLRLWAEVALCLASASAASEDEDGRGSGGEAKAKGILRWRLFHRTGDKASPLDPDDEDIGEDVTLLKATDFSGPERDPPPPNAPRLFCILGDIENEPSYYERAWEISKHRYARAQKSLGEYYLQNKEWEKAREAYRKATAVNRLSPEMWSRLGDISLRLAHALWSLYCEVVAEAKNNPALVSEAPVPVPAEDEEDDVALTAASKPSDRGPATLLAQSLAAYKRGASIAHDNWRIWDNVLTLASRVQPPAIPDMILALKHIIQIRKSEDALDADVLGALLQDAVLSVEKPSDSGVYEPPRGTPERLVMRLFEEEVVPLITQRSELWTLVSRLRAWKRDYAGAIDAAERAWRAAVGSSGSGLLPGAAATTADEARDWTVDEGAWTIVVQRTDELVSVFENWGPSVESIGSKWKGKARSAVRSVMGRGKERWEGSEGWKTLETLMEGLRISS